MFAGVAMFVRFGILLLDKTRVCNVGVNYAGYLYLHLKIYTCVQ